MKNFIKELKENKEKRKIFFRTAIIITAIVVTVLAAVYNHLLPEPNDEEEEEGEGENA